MSTLTPEERLQFDGQLDMLREKKTPGHIKVSETKIWAVVFKGTYVQLTPIDPENYYSDPDALPF